MQDRKHEEKQTSSNKHSGDENSRPAFHFMPVGGLLAKRPAVVFQVCAVFEDGKSVIIGEAATQADATELTRLVKVGQGSGVVQVTVTRTQVQRPTDRPRRPERVSRPKRRRGHDGYVRRSDEGIDFASFGEDEPRDS